MRSLNAIVILRSVMGMEILAAVQVVFILRVFGSANPGCLVSQR